MTYLESSEAPGEDLHSAFSHNSADPNHRLPRNPRQLMKHKAKETQS
jgi:hypothetical protein